AWSSLSHHVWWTDGVIHRAGGGGGPQVSMAASESGASPSAQESVSLEPGKPIERELSGGQSHFYKITMISGQYLRVTVSQQGIDALERLPAGTRSEEHTSELQSLTNLVCRLLLEKKKNKNNDYYKL